MRVCRKCSTHARVLVAGRVPSQRSSASCIRIEPYTADAMTLKWGTVGKWLLVVAACTAACLLAFFFAVADLSIFLKPHLAQFAYRIHRAPWLILRPFHWFVGLSYIVIVVLPLALSVG